MKPTSSRRNLRRWIPGILGTATLLGLATLPIVARDYPSTILSQQPVGYWRLEENEQPTVNSFSAANLGSLGSAENGTYTDSVTRGQPGAFPGGGNSALFSNPDFSVTYYGPVVDIPNSPDLNPNGAFSVEFWALANAQFPVLLSPLNSLDTTQGRQGYLFYAGADGTHGTVWEFRVGDSGGYKATAYGPTVTAGAWTHLVGVYNGSAITLYVNGVATAPVNVPSFSPNQTQPTRIGATTIPNRGWDGNVQEVAVYSGALTADQVTTHYNTGLTNGGAYASTVLGDHPLGYWRLGEAPNQPPPVAVNLGSLGNTGNGGFVYGSNPGQPGPSHALFPGFPAGNSAVALNGTNGYVSLPGLGLNTNTITISAWVYSNGTQSTNAGIVFTSGQNSIGGLKTDVSDLNGLAYDWNGVAAAGNFKSSLVIPDSKWTFVALSVTADTAVLALHDGTSFVNAINYDAVHGVQGFSDEWRIGNDAAYPGDEFNGLIDEVAIFNRALSLGELYTQYASAVGNAAPQIFSGATGPGSDVSVGDSFTVTADAGGTPPLTYQWYIGTSPIPGATFSTFTNSAAALTDTGDYTLKVTNGAGSTSSASAFVNVISLTAPVITKAPVGRTVYAGGLATLSVSATGGQLKYQWSKGPDAIPGATNSSLVFSSISSTNGGGYTVTVRNSLGLVTSDQATLTVVVPTAGSFEAIILGDKPEAWWRLNDAPGSTVLLDSVGRHDGQFTGTGITLGQPGVGNHPGGGSVAFDGSGGFGTIPYAAIFNPKTNFTIEGWAKPTEPGPELSPFSSYAGGSSTGRGYGFVKSSGDSWYGINGNNDQYVYYYLDLGNIRLSQWTHLALVSGSSGITFYRDGKYVGGPYGNYVPNLTQPLIIGGRNNDGKVHQFWKGQVAEVTFYASALSDAQIEAHYQAALYGTNSAPSFLDQPVSETVVVGQPVTFSASVGGTTPLSLQWFKDTSSLAGETNETLTIDPTSFGSIGNYSLVASNPVGSTTSSIVSLTVVSPPVYANITNGLVLHLPFDADASDTSGRGNNGSYVGSPALVPGIIGTQALHYNTDTANSAFNYVTLGTPADLQFSTNINFSVSLWVRLPKGSLSGDLPFLCNAAGSYSNPGYTFAPSYKLGGWSWSLGGSDIYGPDGSINDGKWHHLLYAFDRSGLGITYLDGEEVDSRLAIGSGDLDTGSPTNIGQDPTGTYAESGSADLDDLGIWTRTLTAYDAWTIYQVGSTYNTSFDSTTIPANANVAITMQPHSDGTTSLYWSVGHLQSSSKATGPWVDVSGGSSAPHVVTPSGVGTYYRVQF
jgi:hypothetical protein